MCWNNDAANYALGLFCYVCGFQNDMLIEIQDLFLPGWPLEPWCCWCPECLLSGYARFGRLRAIQCSWAFCSCCPRSADPVAPLWTNNNILRHSGDRGPYAPQYARKEGRRRRGRGRTCKKQDHRGPYVEKKQFWRLEYGGYIWRSNFWNLLGSKIDSDSY